MGFDKLIKIGQELFKSCWNRGKDKKHFTNLNVLVPYYPYCYLNWQIMHHISYFMWPLISHTILHFWNISNSYLNSSASVFSTYFYQGMYCINKFVDFNKVKHYLSKWNIIALLVSSHCLTSFTRFNRNSNVRT